MFSLEKSRLWETLEPLPMPKGAYKKEGEEPFIQAHCDRTGGNGSEQKSGLDGYWEEMLPVGW